MSPTAMLEVAKKMIEAANKNLLRLAAIFSTVRKAELEGDPEFSADYPYKIFRPIKATCDDCGQEHLRETTNGF